MEGSYDFEFLNTVPWVRAFRFILDGAPVSLAGAKMHMQLRLNAQSDDVAMNLSTLNGRLVIDAGDGGIWRFAVTQADAEQVAANAYLYDLTIHPASGPVYSIVGGSFNVQQGITREFTP